MPGAPQGAQDGAKSIEAISADADLATVTAITDRPAETWAVASIVPGPGIVRLDLRFDVARLSEALETCLAHQGFRGNMHGEGLAAVPLNRRPGVEVPTPNDLSGPAGCARASATSRSRARTSSTRARSPS